MIEITIHFVLYMVKGCYTKYPENIYGCVKS